MSKPINRTTANPIGALVTDCISRCEAFAACGGNRGEYPWATPCGCAHTVSSGMRHKCEACTLVCRERKKVGPNGLEPDFASRIDEGMLLDQVTMQQDLTRQYPLFIPMNTFEISPEDINHPLRWVAADLVRLFNKKTVRAPFVTPQSTQEYLRADQSCNLVAVLNGQDSYLEDFWGMRRGDALERLRASGFSVVTGATFSVHDLTPEGTPMPYSHNTAMLMRHHRVLNEIQAAGMEAAPNLYWVDEDQREQQIWLNWLVENTQICTITREFSYTRDTEVVMSKLYELIALLNKVGRPFHVLIVGTGCNTAPLVLKALAEAGHSGSIISSAPVQAARFNTMYRLGDDGQIIDEQRSDKKMPFSKLRVHNMEVFEQALFRAVEDTPSELKAVPNVLAVKP